MDETWAKANMTRSHGRCRRGAFQTILPAGKDRSSVRYRASKADCEACALKPRCCPARKVTRSIHEGARELARKITSSDAYVASAYDRKKVEMLFAHLKTILGLIRLRLRGRNGAKEEVLMGATVQNLRKLAIRCPRRPDGRGTPSCKRISPRRSIDIFNSIVGQRALAAASVDGGNANKLVA